MFSRNLSKVISKPTSSEQSTLQNRNSTPHSENLTIEIGRTLANIGDRLNTEYFEEWNYQRQTDNIITDFASDAARTLFVVLICGWCDNLR